MALFDRENVDAAQKMYRDRIETLKVKVSKIVSRGEHLGEEYEMETMYALDEIEEELQGIEECLALLRCIRRS